MAVKSIATSPQLYARACGALYLAVIVFGAFSEGFVTNKLIDPANAAVSAGNILAAPMLWNLGVGANLLVVMLALPQLWLEYLILKPVNKNLALLAVMFNLLSLAVEAVSKLFLFIVMPILSKGPWLAAFAPTQLHQFADMALQLHDVAFNVALLFFAFTCLIYGSLILRSGFLPGFIGVLMMGTGVSYLIACSAALFSPSLHASITPGILLPVLVGETSFCLWLLIKGVNVREWHRRHASLAPA